MALSLSSRAMCQVSLLAMQAAPRRAYFHAQRCLARGQRRPPFLVVLVVPQLLALGLAPSAHDTEEDPSKDVAALGIPLYPREAVRIQLASRHR